MPLSFWFNHFLDSRAEIHQMYFGFFENLRNQKVILKINWSLAVLKINIKPKLKIVVNNFAWCSANARSFIEMTMVSFFFLLRLVVRAKYMPNIVWPHFSTHTVTHSTRPSFRPKINNQPLKKFLSLAVSWVEVGKYGKILTSKVNFLCQKLSESF